MSQKNLGEERGVRARSRALELSPKTGGAWSQKNLGLPRGVGPALGGEPHPDEEALLGDVLAGGVRGGVRLAGGVRPVPLKFC